jgi:hypothetical protein
VRNNRTTIVKEWNEARTKYKEDVAARLELMERTVELAQRIPDDSPLWDMLNPYIRDGLYLSSQYTVGEKRNMEGVKWLRDLLREAFGEWSDQLVEVEASSKTRLSVTYRGHVNEIPVRFEVQFTEEAARECGILSENCEIKETETTIKGTSVVCGAKHD